MASSPQDFTEEDGIMFKLLRSMDQHAPLARRDFIELCERFEDLGMYGRVVDLDVWDTGFVFSRRTMSWKMQWAVEAACRKADGATAIHLFLGKPGSLLGVFRPYQTGAVPDKLDLRFDLYLSCASEAFKALVEGMKACDTPAAWLQGAQSLAEFFLKLRD